MCETSPCPDIVTAILAKLTEILASSSVTSSGVRRRLHAKGDGARLK
jgi:hypothetical protein